MENKKTQIGPKLHMHLVGLEPTASPSIPLLLKKEVPFGQEHINKIRTKL